jgi:hypothetical protein
MKIVLRTRNYLTSRNAPFGRVAAGICSGETMRAALVLKSLRIWLMKHQIQCSLRMKIHVRFSPEKPLKRGGSFRVLSMNTV